VAPSALGAQKLPLARYTAENGLAGSQVWDLRVDRRGLLWVASTWGFSRFDGERFTTLSVQDGLPSPNARTILEDRDGVLWLGTGDGVARYDGISVVAQNDLPEAPRGTVWASAADGAGRLWFATERGLVRFADGRFRRFGRADGLADDYVYALLLARDGALWTGSRGAGAARCELDERGELARCRRFDAGALGSGVVRSIAEDRAGRILLGTRGAGIAIWDGAALRSLRAGDGLESDDVYALLVRGSGQLVAGGARGLAICLAPEPRRCRVVREANGLPADDVRALAEDPEGTLWIGTEGGLAQMIRDDFWSYSVAEGLPSRHVYALAEDAENGLWVGTVGGLAHLVLGAHGEPSVTRYGAAEGLPSPWVWTVHVDRFGAVWAGTEQGLCRLRAGRCERYDAARGLPSSYSLAIAERGDALWVGTTTGVARLRRDGRGEVVAIDAFDRDDGLAGDRAYALAIDADGRVWVAHAEALSVFEGERFRPVQVGAGFGARSLRGLGLDRSGRLLVGAFGQLARHEGEDRFRRWTRSAGLGDEMILTLAEDDRGRFVLGGHRGVVLFDPEAAAGRGEVVARFDAASGTVASEVSHSGAFVRDRAGAFWFGFKGGLTRLPPDPMPAPLGLPRVEFARIGSGRGRAFVAPFLGPARGPVGWLGAAPPEFPSSESQLRAEARARTFRQRSDLRFQFRLDGDADWSEPRAEPFRDLTRLPPGEHVLRARAARPDSEWGPEAALAFRVRAGWWQTATFRAGVAGAALALLAAALAWRARRTRALEVELERRIAERTDDLARYAAALGEHLQTVDRASDRARRAESARRELFARASHELRTPLTALLGFSELLERSAADRLDERERRHLANVRDSGELLLRQINNLLDQLKLEAGRMELHLDEISIAGLVESVASLMEGYAHHRGVALEVANLGAPEPVRADLAKLRQVLMNLLSNAIKFSPPGEAVSIAVASLAPEESPWPDGGYRITIRDRGPGIPPEAIDAIFEPYRQLAGGGASAPAGTGLGLSISRQFVELLGGRIEVESEPGCGAEFRIVLPAEPKPEVAAVELAEAGAFEPVRPQLVVVDADRERFARLSAAAASADLLAVRADDAAALRRIAGALRPRAAVLVVEAGRPERWREAEEAIRALAERSTPLVVLSVAGELALALAFGAVVPPDAAEATVRQALRAVGTGGRTAGRRPLALVAARRECGVRFGGALASAGCDHFRVEGEEASRALAEVTPDLVAADWAHALDLATELALPAAASAQPILLIDAGEAAPGDLARLAERIAEAGEPLERALVSATARLAGAASVESAR
jgi:signal transduction histidine kinase/ligand-binding sensor domain-containing protein